MALPVVNFYCTAALAALCYRALAGTADPADAPLTTRLLEDLQSDKTELMLKLSALKSDIQIAKQRVIEAQHDSEQTQLDLRIFNDKNPPPPPRKGIFSKRLSSEQRESESHRRELEQICEQCTEDLAGLQEKVSLLEKQQGKHTQELEAVKEQQAEQTNTLTSQVAADVITQVICGKSVDAKRQIASLRQMLRGNLMLGTLSVIQELLVDGYEGAQYALQDAKLIFEQHPDPVKAIFEQLHACARDEKTQQKPGVYRAEAFSSRQLFLLSQLWFQHLVVGHLTDLSWKVNQFSQLWKQSTRSIAQFPHPMVGKKPRPMSWQKGLPPAT